VRFAKNGTTTYSDFYTADNSLGQAAPADVRTGTVYANGNLTGTCAVPAAGSVALGVPVDATTGTAVLTPADVQSALTAQGLTTARAGALDNLDATVSSRLAPNGTLATVTTLTNAPDVPTEGEIASAVWSAASREITGGTVTTLTNAPASVTPSDIWSHATRTITGGLVDTATTLTNAPTVPTASQIASQVRTELSSELAKVSALNTTRLGQCTTTEILGNLLAQANS
jgi:hypothetical protein